MKIDSDVFKPLYEPSRILFNAAINGDQKKALDFFTKQYDTFIKLADKRKIADAIGNVGIINFQIGNIAEAKLNFEKQFSIAQKLNDDLCEYDLRYDSNPSIHRAQRWFSHLGKLFN